MPNELSNVDTIISPTTGTRVAMKDADTSSTPNIVVPAPEELDPRVPCPVCKERIVRNAKICVHCKSDLSWKRYLTVSNTTLALLTALLAVMGTVGVQVKQLILPPNSKIAAVWLNSSIATIPERIELTVMNTGELAGTVVEANMRMRVTELPPWLASHLKGKKRTAAGWWTDEIIVIPNDSDKGFLIIKPMSVVGHVLPFMIEPGPAKRISLQYHYSRLEGQSPSTLNGEPSVESVHCEVSLGVIDARGRFGGVTTAETLCRLRSNLEAPEQAVAPPGGR